MKTLHIVLLASILLATEVHGATANITTNTATSIFQNQYAKDTTVFHAGGRSLGYPEYRDREGWARFIGNYSDHFIKEGEKYLDFKYEHIPASVFLNFETGGDRSTFNADNRARKALNCLVMAEIAEGKGRFMSKIIDGVWYFAERISWVHPQHAKRKSTRRSLGDPDEEIIGITSSFNGVIVALAYNLFHEEWDRIDSSISRAVRRSLDTHIINPFLDESLTDSNWWLGFTPGMPIINWCPWINHNSVLVSLLVEEDQSRLNAVLRRSFKSLDNYMNYLKPDGGCDEGPSYWHEATGKVYDYIYTLNQASGGRFNLLGLPRLQKMGRYYTDIYIRDGWIVSHADGSARIEKSDFKPSFIYRFGVDTGIPELVDLAAAYSTDRPEGDTYNTLECLRYLPGMKAHREAGIQKYGTLEAYRTAFESTLGDAWYPENEVAVLRRGEWFLWTLGHNNYAGPRNDTHNHDDVGSFVLYLANMPVFIDMGRATPTNGTYDKERYSFFHIRSESHNTACINGCEQQEGADCRATATSCSLPKGTMAMDIQEAYGKEACAKRWTRSFRLDKNGLTMKDNWTLTERKAANSFRFMARGLVTMVKPGLMEIRICDFERKQFRTVQFTYPSSLDARVETITLDDPALSKIWGPELKRIVLTEKENAPLRGSAKFIVSPVPHE